MKHTIKLLALAFMLATILTLTGCPGPVNNYIEPIHEHVFGDWGDWEVVNAATCTKDGSKKRTRTCSCGEVEEETAVIAALGHDWELESDTATCTEDGVKTYKCSRCNETRTEDSPAHHHVDYETSGYCETCRVYKWENRLTVNICKLETEECEEVYFSFNTKTVEMNLNDLIHLKSDFINYEVLGYGDSEEIANTNPYQNDLQPLFDVTNNNRIYLLIKLIE